ncbi:uncharacterized protein VDAG_07916 [Verticillium dahliae VdLs.17]|uniref:Uncharacterized protein n=1 Tax=Verticillium dahliae (strain VdLs.17 / ATCC MYA-4575 / FGSC 10137) TaxID=498257 RepID=G2XCN4_VERDV|nr:uncharacterized protein VDAG_07916 [Verticillium dahliae VdLs.17]EGY16752.1 hypothetical protein VDAG_07916 [Verticillium dahliae VdLs.17]
MITPLVQSPASPADLLHYIVSYQTYPTTLLICASRADFLASLQQDIHAQLTTPALDTEPARTLQPTSASPLLQAPLYQVAVAKHIRIAFLPTVAHLRAYLAAFSPHDPAKVAAPPTADGPPTAPGRRPPPAARLRPARAAPRDERVERPGHRQHCVIPRMSASAGLFLSFLRVPFY